MTVVSVGATTVTALPPHLSTNTVVGLQTAAAETLASGAPADGPTATRLTATALDAGRQPLAGVQVGFDPTLGTPPTWPPPTTRGRRRSR